MTPSCWQSGLAPTSSMDGPGWECQGSSPTAPEAERDLLRSVQTILRELDTQRPDFRSNRGMWQWSLHKKIERDPRKSLALVRILLNELERVERGDQAHHIIPLLHTLIYTLTKAPCTSDNLFDRAYAFCTRLLTLPRPYCSLAWHSAILLKLEKAVPGLLYQRTVLAEHSLPNEMYLYQEQVFLFVDPDLVSTAVCNALLLEVEGTQQQPRESPWACMFHVVAQAMRMALGKACDVGALQRRLKNGPRSDLERCFHAVVAMVQQAGSELGATQGGHVRRLEELYRSLLGAEVVGDDPSLATPPALPPVIPLPSPRIGFYLWTDKEQLWKELVRFLHSDPCDHCDPSCLHADPEAFDVQGLAVSGQAGEPARFSILSTDSGIERDLPPGPEEIPEPEQFRLQRKGGVRKRVGPLEAWLPPCWQGLAGDPRSHAQPPLGAQPLHTARVVVLGDDRMLGRLAQAYLELR
ncbi:phosphoinositide 3-kinase regulatory subunit 6 [Ornithorhynchus anatinus]|uniref:phosphoinositide 3-kinase regulatory subunit 6 n=1 Tax=Ornithorhynchus anatinus TaxID=9258 RepID=UPI0019D46535|nr:phosphoinositide 3-kinase regulatory subunit 6 [Ornithorhynchus anatinus]